jgi:glycosyltransferase involved in cell wall biosynthesis
MQVTAIGGKDACQDVGFPIRIVKPNGTIRKLMFHVSDSLYHLIHPRVGGKLGPYRRWLSRIHCDLRYDLLHFPFQVPPRATFRCPFIVTMHDVQELHFPEFFSPETRLQRADLYWGAISQASRVVVSFDHVKEDLLKYFRLPDARVVVIPVPYSECGFADLPGTDSIDFSSSYRDLGRYFLYPAQTWRHKNHLGLIDAFERVCQRYSEPLSLVCTGVKNDFFHQEIKERIDRCSAGSRIHFLGVVPQEQLKWLYRNALSVVVPSLYEAGSFPLIEAMQLQSPVLCASTTSLPSTIGDLRFVFDPRNIEQMADLMFRMASDPDYRQQGIYNSRLRMEALREIKVGPLVEELWRTTLERPEVS